MQATFMVVVLLAGGFSVCSPAASFAQMGQHTLADSSGFPQRKVESRTDSLNRTANNEYLPKWYYMISRIPGDWIEYSSQTFRPENIIPIAGMAAVTAGLIVTDRETYITEKGWYDRSPAFHKFTDLLTFTGDGRFQFGIVGAFAAYGFAFNDVRALRTASETTEAILACGGVVQLLKHVTGRESPFVATTPTGAWRFFPNQIDYARHVPHYDAFPSGHIATAMTTLIVIAENYPELKWLKPAGYIVLLAISSSLVASGIHWWSDIPLGLALGYSFGEIAAHPRGINLGGGADGAKLILFPASIPNGAGVGISVLF